MFVAVAVELALVNGLWTRAQRQAGVESAPSGTQQSSVATGSKYGKEGDCRLKGAVFSRVLCPFAFLENNVSVTAGVCLQLIAP